MSKFVGIIRSNEFSPNSNDLMIMQKVSACIQSAGHHVDLVNESDYVSHNVDADAYFSMARGHASLAKLSEEETKGRLVINSPKGVENCARPVITDLMAFHQMPMPKSKVLDLKSAQQECLSDWNFPCWLKRGDSCAQQKADVSFIQTETDFEQAKENFISRGIYSAVLCEHLEGDVVKFYGVADSPFFYWYYPTLGQSHSKFGLEEINGPAHQFTFDVKKLKQAADRIAQIANTPIYGGDCIVDAKGVSRIIDFNDWPSFSRCVDEAADAISAYILKNTNDGSNY